MRWVGHCECHLWWASKSGRKIQWRKSRKRQWVKTRALGPLVCNSDSRNRGQNRLGIVYTDGGVAHIHPVSNDKNKAEETQQLEECMPMGDWPATAPRTERLRVSGKENKNKW